MRRNSLAFRLFIASAAWSLIVLPATAIILVSVYRSAVESNFDARLNVYLTTLVAGVATRESSTTTPPSLSDPSFKLPFSGWYWQLSPLNTSDELIQTSESLLDQRILLPSAAGAVPDKNLVRRAYISGPEQQQLRVLEREIRFQAGSAPERSFSVAVAGDSDDIEIAVTEFRNLLIIALSILGTGLLVATFFQVQYGLRPLRSIRQGLSAIRSGESELLDDELPREIEPLQVELNALIESNRSIVERARTHVGNLAHALKTPLSVITNEANSGKSALAGKVREQASIMRQQIDHHLNRASIGARAGIVSGNTAVAPVMDALVRTLDRIYADRGLNIELDCDEDVIFNGEKQDLEEMVGNLLDNACKWARSRVVTQVHVKGAEIEISVEDDGPGLSKKQMEDAIKRGRRLDETQPGSGLGLSIVADLAHLYKGRLVLDSAGKSGLRACLSLPHSRRI